MLRRTRGPLACLPPLCLLLAVPAAALARNPHKGGGGGSSISGTGGSSTTSDSFTTTSTTAPGTLAPGVVMLDGVVDASGDGITFTVAASGTQGQPLTITGDAPGSDSGATIYIESAKPGRGNWAQVATATIASNGSFSTEWTPATSAQVALRAVLAAAGTDGTGSGGGSGLSASLDASAAAGELTTSALTIPIFKDARATLYGPGLWGHRTACGQRLTRATLGIASRTLKCGARVAVVYGGRELTVRVIDRGPFANGASWDLTMATATALGISQTVTIGTLSPAPPTALPARANG